jgi:streptogramin lyase
MNGESMPANSAKSYTVVDCNFPALVIFSQGAAIGREAVGANGGVLMTMSWRGSMMLLGLAAFAANGCGNGGNGGNGGPSPNAGSVVLDMPLAPPNAHCAVITVTPQGGGMVVTQSFTLTPEAQAVFTLSNLPTGTATIAEQVFTVACNALTGAVPGWVSQNQTISINPGEPVTVALTLVPNASGGQVTVQTTFVTPSATLTQIPLAVSPNRIASAGMTAGPDGAVWLAAEVGTQRKGDPSTFTLFRVSTNGFVSSFTSGIGDVGEGSMTAGPDGNVWYTSFFQSDGALGRVSPAGNFAVFSIPVGVSSTTVARPAGITTGSDGNIWFTDSLQNQIGNSTVNGQMAAFPITTGSSGLGSIATGPDGNLWFTEQSPSRIGRMSKTGSLVEFSTPTSSSFPASITAGPDGNLWFIESGANKIGRISTTGSIVEFNGPTGINTNLQSLIAGPDGAMWFVDIGNQAIGRITTLGVVTEFPLEISDRLLGDMALGSDGKFYLSEFTEMLQYQP